MNCKKCGAINSTDSKFCTSCGNVLEEEVIQTEPGSNQVSEPVQEVVNIETPVSSDTVVQTTPTEPVQPVVTPETAQSTPVTTVTPVETAAQTETTQVQDQAAQVNQTYTQVQAPVIQNIVPSNTSSNKGIISVILGVVGIPLAILLNILVIFIPIIGLIFGMKGKKNNESKGLCTLGTVLNSINIGIVVVVFVSLLVTFIRAYPVVGKYNCQGLYDDDGSYSISLNLNFDGSFLFGPYGDLDNNHLKGTYTVSDYTKVLETVDPDAKYYSLKLKGSKDYVINGVKQNRVPEPSNVVFAVNKKNGKKEAVLIFIENYNMYYCSEK